MTNKKPITAVKTMQNNIPQHVAIIMDGNRRWAKQRGLALIMGHREVADRVIENLVDFALEKGIKYLTLWAFSTENWQRSEKEVSDLMQLFRETFQRSYDKLREKGVRVAHIGDLNRFAPDIRAGIKEREAESKDNQRLLVTFALNYGGQDEILRASRQLLRQAKSENWSEQEIAALNKEQFAHFLDTQQLVQLPDPDLLIRTGGEQRLSGFLSWQIAYTELYFTDVLMPDFSPAEFAKALQDFANRRRRFGK